MSRLPLTLFTTCKPFRGETAAMQHNALRSWSTLNLPTLVFGDESGVAEACRRVGARQLATVARNPEGTPLVSDLFRQAERTSDSPWLAYVNADIMLGAALLPTLNALFAQLPAQAPALIVARRINIPLCREIADSEDLQRAIDDEVAQYGCWDLANAVDLFIYRRGLFQDIPDLAVGRMQWDNWLLWKARDEGAMVIDATGSLPVIHPIHGYASHTGGWHQVTQGSEARLNRELCDGHLLDIDQASTHCFVEGRLADRQQRFQPAVAAPAKSLAAGIEYLMAGLDQRSVTESLDALRSILWHHQAFFPLHDTDTDTDLETLRRQLHLAREHLLNNGVDPCLQALQNILVTRLVIRAEKIFDSGRPLLIWGAGQMGRRLQGVFERFKIPFNGFIDSNRALLHQSVNGKPVVASQWRELDHLESHRPFVFIASMYYREIADDLTAGGWVEGQDFVA